MWNTVKPFLALYTLTELLEFFATVTLGEA
jgi:hypothetical protein